MLVVISDLHFIDGTAGEHNLPASAFKSVFLTDILALAHHKHATEIKLLLLGDIPDLVRSQQWFEEDPADRPWGENGLREIHSPVADSRVEQRALRILGKMPADGRRQSVPQDTILYKNWDTFSFFRNFERIVHQRLGREIPVQIIYVPGNHDRLVNLYPGLRDELRTMIGLTINRETAEVESPWEWWFRYDYIDERYGVYARHGHQYDAWNFGGGNDFTRKGHVQAAIGDAIATEFAVNLPRTLSQLRPKYPRVNSKLVENLKEVDNVRPLGRIAEWFHYKMKQEHSEEVRRALDETFDTVLNEFLQINFVQQWRSPETRWDDLIRTASHPWLRGLVDTVTRHTNTEDLLHILLPYVEREISSDESQDHYSDAAYRERIWRENPEIRTILYGHTHRPTLRPLDGAGDHDVVYLNTGTWRGHIHRTVPQDKSADFIKLKQMTFACFYNADEDRDGKKQGTVSFDMWTGHRLKEYVS